MMETESNNSLAAFFVILKKQIIQLNQRLHLVDVMFTRILHG